MDVGNGGEHFLVVVRRKRKQFELLVTSGSCKLYEIGENLETDFDCFVF